MTIIRTASHYAVSAAVVFGLVAGVTVHLQMIRMIFNRIF